MSNKVPKWIRKRIEREAYAEPEEVRRDKMYRYNYAEYYREQERLREEEEEGDEEA